jgi:hypothetical protein
MATTYQITASFEVSAWNEEPVDENIDAAKLTHARVSKTYAGDIDAHSATEWLMAYSDDGSASFVGLERINGTISGRRGTLVLQHVGTFIDGAATATLTVVAGCGSGDFVDATGTGTFVADPAGKISLELAIT